MEYIEVSAKTVEDALTEASVKLGTTSDKLEYEIIEKGSTGFLGIGSKNAVIKVKVHSYGPVAVALNHNTKIESFTGELSS